MQPYRRLESNKTKSPRAVGFSVKHDNGVHNFAELFKKHKEFILGDCDSSDRERASQSKVLDIHIIFGTGWHKKHTVRRKSANEKLSGILFSGWASHCVVVSSAVHCFVPVLRRGFHGLLFQKLWLYSCSLLRIRIIILLQGSRIVAGRHAVSSQ